MIGDRDMSLRRLVLRVSLFIACVVSWSCAQQPAPRAQAPADRNVGDETPVEPPGSVVYVIPIQGEINNLTVDFVEWGLGQAAEKQAQVVVLELDTPGGAVTSMFDVNQAIRNASAQYRIIAWVNPDAYSAGAAIALACDEMVVSQNNRIGDAAPIMVGPQGLQELPETERAKITSPILAEFRSSAERNGYPVVLCEAMVVLGPAVWQIEHRQTREVRYVYEDTLDDFGLNVNDADNPFGEWRLVKKVHNAGELFTMYDEQPIEYGFAQGFVDTDQELLQYIGPPARSIERFEPNWSQAFFGWLTTPAVRGILMFLVIMGVYMEMQSPGLGAGAAIALSAAAVMLGAPYMTGLAEMMDLVLILVGVVLIGVELFLLPGFGIAGFFGISFVFFGMLMTFVPENPGDGYLPDTRQAWDAMEDGIVSMVLASVASIVGCFFLTKYFGSIPVLNRMILVDQQAADPALSAASPGTGEPAAMIDPLVGKTGVALGDIRGGGRAEVDGQTLDVVTAGEWIERGEAVRVAAVRGNVVTVERA
jgi:membrane-bound serine protease (ClpP class)